MERRMKERGENPRKRAKISGHLSLSLSLSLSLPLSFLFSSLFFLNVLQDYERRSVFEGRLGKPKAPVMTRFLRTAV